ncbi:MAG: SMC-Scp complex subunit ScpB [Dinghuibacter sp.]|nr:SMC-Scp complex subunit ScpB [Dinghuibacter sp.]
MEIAHLIPHIEALIFASDRPLTGLEITDYVNNAFGFMEDKVVLDQVESALEGIAEKYQSDFYPFQAVQSGGGWQFLTKKDYHKTVAQLNGDKFMKRLSGASLETLAIVAYKQPITKGEIEAIRGVNSDYSVQKLLEKELIVISGRNEKLPGHPLVYSVSKNFMDYFGLNTTEDLPKIREVLAEEMAAQTYVNALQATAETGAPETEAEATEETATETGSDHTAEAETVEEATAEAEQAGEEEPTDGETDAGLYVNDQGELAAPEPPENDSEHDDAQQPEA